jgi:hypothetical protein
VRGHENVRKRLLLHAGAFNLGLLMRTRFGVGTPRALQGYVVELVALLTALWSFVNEAIGPVANRHRHPNRSVLSRNPVLACA